MGIKYELKDNRDLIFRRLAENSAASMEALAPAMVEAVQNQMLYGYHTPHGPDGHTEIVDTGRLFDSISADVNQVSQNAYSVNVGVPAGTIPAEYAQFVHDGTSKLEGRPFITDGLTSNEAKAKIKDIYSENLPVGFE